MSKTKKYWFGKSFSLFFLDWYDGLSDIMIRLPCKKMLFTLSKDRLDDKLREAIYGLP